MDTPQIQKAKQQIIFSSMPIAEKDFWLILIKYLNDDELEKMQSVLNLKTEISKQKRKLTELEIKKNQIIKEYNSKILENIRKKLENIIEDNSRQKDLVKIEEVRNQIKQYQND